MDQLVLIFIALLLLGTALFIYRRLPRGLTRCPNCGYAQPPEQWPLQNQRRHVNGRYTITPLPTCPQCNFVYEEPKPGKRPSTRRKDDRFDGQA